MVRAQLERRGRHRHAGAWRTALEADYRRYSDERSLAFNLAYAEGFEAMTFALARSAMSTADAAVAPESVPEWANLIRLAPRPRRSSTAR